MDTIMTYSTKYITIGIYLIFLLGIVLLEADNIEVLFKRRRLRHRLVKGAAEGKISSRCSALLSGALGKSIDGAWLILFEAVLFLMSFAISIKNFTVIMAFMIAALISGFPILLLYSRLMTMQDRGSKEAVSLVTEFYRQYRMNDLNVFTAIEKTIECNGNYPICKRQLSILLIRLRDAAGRQAVREHCRRFAFALGCSWGKMLSSCIEIAVLDGTDISAALEDITDQIKISKTQLEERKRLNGEAMRMTVFLVPLLYIATIYASVKYLGIGLPKFLHNQFFTTEGLMFFLVSVILFFANIILLNLINNGKGDF